MMPPWPQLGPEIADEPFEPELLESAQPYRGRVWDVREDAFRYLGGTLRRHYIAHPGAVAVLALDAQDRVCLIRQYRHPVRTREWELPAGLLDVAGESAVVGAQRELAEEVDLAAASWALLAEYAPSPGASDELIRIYLARELTPTGTAFDRHGEEADLLVAWVALDDAVAAVRAGRVQNSIAVVGLLSAWFERERGWAGLRPADSPWRHTGVAP